MSTEAPPPAHQPSVLSVLSLVGLSLVLTTAPHTGTFALFGLTGRTYSIDELINIDAGLAFLRQGWVTYRNSSLAFEPLVSSGALASILPALATLLSDSYAFGRQLSVLQNALALGAVAYTLERDSGEKGLGWTFLSLVLLIPGIMATFVYSQAEILAFAALFLGVRSLWKPHHPLVSGTFIFLAVHFKLISIIHLVGVVGFEVLAWRLKGPPDGDSHSPDRLPLRQLGLPLALATLFLGGWQIYQWLVTPSHQFTASLQKFAQFFVDGGSGMASTSAKLPRWQLIFSPRSEFGSFKPSSQALILVLGATPFLAFCRKFPIAPWLKALLCGSLLHLTWWLFFSESIWIRHSFIALLTCSAWGALLLTGTLKRTIGSKYALIMTALLCAFVVGTKTWTGIREWNRPLTGEDMCPLDLERKGYCHATTSGEFLKFIDFKLPLHKK